MPPVVTGGSCTLVLLDVITHRYAALDEIAERVGLHRSTVYKHLTNLRRLVDWVDGQHGTIHSLVRVV